MFKQHALEMARACAHASLTLETTNDLRKKVEALKELRTNFEIQFGWLVLHAGGDNDCLDEASVLNEKVDDAFQAPMDELQAEEAREAGYDIAKRHGTYSVRNGSVS